MVHCQRHADIFPQWSGARRETKCNWRLGCTTQPVLNTALLLYAVTTITMTLRVHGLLRQTFLRARRTPQSKTTVFGSYRSRGGCGPSSPYRPVATMVWRTAGEKTRGLRAHVLLPSVNVSLLRIYRALFLVLPCLGRRRRCWHGSRPSRGTIR